MDGGLRCRTVAQFLAHALVDEHVGVNGHPQHQGHGGHARQGQGSLHHGQHSHQEQQVHGQRHGGKHAKQGVVNTHEHRHRHKTPCHAGKAHGNVFGAQAWANGALFNDFHRRSQRARAQQQGGIGRLHSGHAARNLYPPAANFGANHRGRDHLALAFFKQDDGHALAHALACDIFKNARAFGVQRQIDGGLVGLAIKTGLSIGQVIAGEHHLFFHNDGLAGAV